MEGKEIKLIKDEMIEIKVSKQNKNHYIQQGFNCKVGDAIQIHYWNLPSHSKQRITAICDYCGKEKPIMYYNYLKTTSGIIKKYACFECKGLKTKESNLITYGVESIMQVDEYKEKQKNAIFNNYGVLYPSQSKEIKQKIINTNLSRYGVKNPSMSQIIRQKAKDTCLKKYGVDNYMDTQECKDKLAKTNLEKYGCINPFQNEEVKERQKQTCIERYGCENVFQNEDIKEKIKKTMLNKYGVEYLMQDENYKNMVIRKGLKTKYKHGTVTCSKQQEYIWKLIGGKLNYPIDKLSLDIAFPEEMIYIEYNGSGHDIDVKYGRLTERQFKYQEIKRYKFLKALGWKQIQIDSSKDYLLNNELFIKEINKAKEYLQITKFHHYIIDIDDYDEIQKFKLKSSTDI